MSAPFVYNLLCCLAYVSAIKIELSKYHSDVRSIKHIQNEFTAKNILLPTTRDRRRFARSVSFVEFDMSGSDDIVTK